jgi:hypothetical protein
MKTTEPIDSFSIWDSYWDIGDLISLLQQLVVNYSQLIKFQYSVL